MYEYLKTTTVFIGKNKNNFTSYSTETEHNMVNGVFPTSCRLEPEGHRLYFLHYVCYVISSSTCNLNKNCSYCFKRHYWEQAVKADITNPIQGSFYNIIWINFI